MKKLYLAWQDPLTRRWFPVGRLTLENQGYRFVYTKGANQSPRFIPFGRMNELKTVYEATELFPLFANRLLSKARPEYQDYLKWLNLESDGGEDQELVMLALTGGLRGTDSLEVFPCPLPTSDSQYTIKFFSHGLRHLPLHVVERVNTLNPGDRLFLLFDIQNPHDLLSIALRTDDPVVIVGYCPRYLNEDFRKILSRGQPEKIDVRVEQVNREAPVQLRLLCNLTAPWPESFEPCSGELFDPIPSIT